MKKKAAPESIEIIDPIPFRSGRGPRRPRRSAALKWLVLGTSGMALILLLSAAWFVFSARRVTLEIVPLPDRIEIDGGLTIPATGSGYLMRPGNYTLTAARQCYRVLRHDFSVGDAPAQTVRAAMMALPGKLVVAIQPQDAASENIAGLRIYVDDVAVSGDLSVPLEVAAGNRRVRITAHRYQDYVADIAVESCGRLQTLQAELLPDWSAVTVNSIPDDAEVAVDGMVRGRTPVRLELAAGTHDVELRRPGFQTWRTRLTVAANQPLVLDDVMLIPADGSLTVTSAPPGATVMIDARYAGQTPLTVALASNAAHTIRISKAGYETVERQATLAPEAEERLSVALEARQGVVRFKVEPADAVLTVGGRKIGRPPASLRLLAVDQHIEISKPGYETYRTRITPRPGFDQEIRVSLMRKGAASPTPDGKITAAAGYTLQLIRPRPFTMGSSRRQQGRRPNESLRQIDLKRPFYMGINEVTNAQFRQFQSEHRSGAWKQHRLGGSRQPVVQISWQHAARFCNWLSARESLPPVYQVSGDQVRIVTPIGGGYRLPTEAEWEYCARFRDNQASAKYPWGEGYPPPKGAGNFADQSARDLPVNPLKGYNDGFPVSAPTGQFTATPLGLFDMGGNVAEWCHDYYTIYSYQPGTVYTDPTGPVEGRHRVVRGSSFKHGSMTELRSAYRDYSGEKRPDLGFRVCRYADEAG